MLIDRHLPEFDVFEHHEHRAAAGKEATYAAALDMDMARSPTVALLFALRSLPHLVSGKARPTKRVDLGLMESLGFEVLEEDPGTEIVLGAIGRFWRPTSGLKRFSAASFRTFDEPGFAKAAMNFRVEEDDDRTNIITETRVLCTDPGARKKFRTYWRLVGPFSAYIRRQALRSIAEDAEKSDDEQGATARRKEVRV